MVSLESKRLEDILKLLIGLVLIVFVNTISSRSFFRLDLTEEKRFSISSATDEMLKNLNDVVYIEVYLDGDLPSGFVRMRRAIYETLEEFRVRSGNMVQFKFVNPDQAAGAQARNEFITSIARKGIQPIDVFNTENGNQIQKRILPGAIVNYGVGEKAVMLFKGNAAAAPEVQLNQSIEGVEFEIASAIRQLAIPERKSVAFVRGHLELDSLDIFSLKQTLQETFLVGDVMLDKNLQQARHDLLVIAKPKEAFSEQEKYYLDQHIMNGGNALFLIDALVVNMDSAGLGTFAFPLELNLQDQLFKYGVRMNPTYVQDVIAGGTPVVVGQTGSQSQVRVLPWPFYPIINNFSDHIITRNLNAVLTRFVGSIDTVKAEGIKKTPLLFTSQYSRVVTAPVKVSLDDLRQGLKPEDMNQSNLPVAYLLEGKFASLYKNRFTPAGVSKSNYREDGQDAKIIVISDGDVARNEINNNTGRPLPLGVDQYSQQGLTYGNQDLIVNAINYLVEDNGLITARAKEIKIRLLDKVKVAESRTQWQLINLLLPILLLLLFGLGLYITRKRKYARV